MIAVVQRVLKASVEIEGKVKSEIKEGVLVLLGIEEEDGVEDIEWLSKKITNLRIFNDAEGVMNKSLIDCSGALMLISQFTLQASTKKGNRPSYIKAAKPAIAVPLYEQTIEALESCLGKTIATGVFGADMQVGLVNDGPVTILLDTKNKK